jgi:hypothetical protein
VSGVERLLLLLTPFIPDASVDLAIAACSKAKESVLGLLGLNNYSLLDGQVMVAVVEHVWQQHACRCSKKQQQELWRTPLPEPTS